MKRARAKDPDKPKRKHVPQQLYLMHKELSRAGGIKPAVFFIVNVVILGLAPVLVMGGTVYYVNVAGTAIPYLVPVVLTAGIAAIALLIFLTVRRLAMLREYARTLPGRIADAGLLKQLARGFESLPDIFAYTKTPWRMLLGNPPQTTEQQLQLLVNSLEWYLLPEPRTYFRPLWRGLPFVAVVFIGLVALVFMAAGGAMHGGPPTALLIGTVCVLVAGLVPVAYFAWQALYAMSCGVVGTQALADAVREYVEQE